MINDIILRYFEDNEEAMKMLITWFLNTVMEYEARLQAGAGYYERTKKRKAHRNGYRSRSLNTRVGKLELKKPQLREVPFQTQVFERYSRVEKALQNAIVESYIQGVSARRVKEIVEALGAEELSPTTVSNIAKELDEKVEAFLNKKIEEEVPYFGHV